MYFPLSELNGWGKRPAMKAEDDLFRGSPLWMALCPLIWEAGVFSQGNGHFTELSIWPLMKYFCRHR